MENLNSFSSKLKSKENEIDKKEWLSKNEKLNLILVINKTEDIISDFKINKIDNKNIKNSFFSYLNLLLNDLDILIKSEKVDTKQTLNHISVNYKSFVNKYKEVAKDNSWFFDEVQWVYLWAKKWIINVSKYVKNDIEWIIVFFSNINNIKKIPQLIWFMIDNFEEVIKNVSQKAQNELKKIKDEFLSLTQLHDKWEISDKLYCLKTTNIGITFAWITLYEFFPLWKITKIKKIEDLEKIIKEWLNTKKIKKIKVTDDNLKSEVHKKLANNIPLLSVERLSPGSKIYNITFTWGIKFINDKFWQENTDLLIDKIQEFFIKHNKNERVIRKNYKHLTIDLIKKEEINLWWKDTWEIITHIIEKNKKLFKSKLWKQFNDFEKTASERIKLWVWTSEIKWNTLKDKLNAFHQAEISARWWDWHNLEISKYNPEEIQNLSEKVFKTEKEILNKYKDKEFFYNWKNYKIVVNNIEWNKQIINPILLRFSRKDKLVKDANWNNMEELNNLTKSYIKNLNNWFDFIAPYINLQQDIKFTKKLNKQIRNWKIDINAFLKDFKWNIPKDLFLKNIVWKEWTAYFIDVKDMWILNLQDFKNLAKQVQEKWIKNIDLTTAWKKVTEQFILFVKNLKKEHPDLEIALWWDEIYIYSKKNINIENSISKDLDKVWFNGRISKYKWLIWKTTIWYLDKSTWIIKDVESPIEYYFTKMNIKIPNISFKSIKWLDLSKDIENMQINININENNIKNIINWEKTLVWKFEWKQIFWELKWNNLILSI